MCWYEYDEYDEEFVPNEIIVKSMVGSTFSSSNMHGFVDTNINFYRNMVMDTMRMNQSVVGECAIVDKEPNADATKFFDLLNYDELLWDGYTNHHKLYVCGILIYD